MAAPTPRTRTVLWALASVAVLGAAAVAAWQVLPGPEGPPDVLVIGDSVSFVSGGAIDQRFVDQEVGYVTKPGYTSGDLLPVVYDTMDRLDIPASWNDTVVVLVGYNDVRFGLEDGDALEELASVTSQFDCAVWLTLPARPGGERSTFEGVDAPAIDAWNARLVAEADRYETLHLARDWEDVITRAPAAELLEDGLHPNVAGQRRLADAMYAAVERNC